MSKHAGQAVAIWAKAINGTQYIEDADGYTIRVWGDPNTDWTTAADVRTWFRGKRVIDDLREGLEFVRPSYIETLIKNDYLRKDVGGFYWITAKAAERFNLEPVLGKKFPK